MLNGEWTDYLQDFMALTEGVESPDIYRRWAGIASVAGALERRVWARAASRPTYPNLYILLVGAPGAGKQIIENVRSLWREARDHPASGKTLFNVAPSDVTKASLIDELAKAKHTSLRRDEGPLTYHSLLFASEEFGVLMPDFDQHFVHKLNEIYNCKDTPYEESRRTGLVKSVSIERPCLNILGGVQPTYLAHTFPEEAWSSGLSRRLTMIFSAEELKLQLFFTPPERLAQEKAVLAKLAYFASMCGEMKWASQAAQALRDWYAGGCRPEPNHSRLEHYRRSRVMLSIKLSIVSAAMRTGHYEIAEGDFARALAWLVEAEGLMPDIFREMRGTSDRQVIEELHRFMREAWLKGKKRGVTSSSLYEFLHVRVPSEKIERILMVAERAKVIDRMAGTQDLWVPGRRLEGGVE